MKFDRVYHKKVVWLEDKFKVMLDPDYSKITFVLDMKIWEELYFDKKRVFRDIYHGIKNARA